MNCSHAQVIESASFSICVYFCSVLVSDHELYATGFHSPLSCFCSKTAPIPNEEASADTLVGFDWLYKHKTGVELNLDLIS